MEEARLVALNKIHAPLQDKHQGRITTWLSKNIRLSRNGITLTSAKNSLECFIYQKWVARGGDGYL